MNTQKLATVIGSAAAALCLISATGQQAQAGQLHNNWNYGIDAFNDGSGGAEYEIKGMAIKQTADSIFVALTSGMPLTGVSASGAADGNIGWGDLFFNFSGTDFQTANNAGNLFGIRFAGTNDSGVGQVGVYGNVTTDSVTTSNNGYSSLAGYYGAGYEQPNSMGTDFPTKTAAYNYLYGTPTPGSTPILNIIKTGTFLGGITSLNGTDLAGEGLDFANFSANDTYTFGFKFDRSLLPNGNFVSHVFEECGNDGVAIKGQLKAVPEPSSIAGIAAVGLMLAGAKIRRRQEVK
jgi:hypothetical protein